MHIKITNRIYASRREIVIREAEIDGEDLEDFKQVKLVTFINHILNAECIDQVTIKITK